MSWPHTGTQDLPSGDTSTLKFKGSGGKKKKIMQKEKKVVCTQNLNNFERNNMAFPDPVGCFHTVTITCK